MAMIKTLARKEGGCTNIKSYLEREGRAITIDGSGDVDLTRWDDQFDEVRKAWGKDAGRKYYHFVISPDPEDGIDADVCRSLAIEWVSTRYPDSQWVVETHVDNGIPHAHVVMNSVFPATGDKAHISKQDVRNDADVLQEMCRERGLSAFDNYEIAAGEDGEWVARAKRDRQRSARRPGRSETLQRKRMRERGIVLWTDEMRDAVENAIKGSCSWTAFCRSLKDEGYDARISRRGVLTIYPPEGKGYPTKGYKIDSCYTVEGIKSRLTPNLKMAGAIVGSLPSNIQTPPMPKTLVEVIESNVSRSKSDRRNIERLRGYLDAVVIARTNGFTSVSQFEKAARAAARRAVELRMELDDAKLVFDQLQEASTRLIQREALKGRMTSTPRASFMLRKWEDDNREEIDGIKAIDDWLAERGLSSDVSLEQVQEKRSELSERVFRLAREAESVEKDARRIGDAARAIAELSIPGPARSIRARERGAAPRIATVMSERQWREYVARKDAQSREAGKLLLEKVASRIPGDQMLPNPYALQDDRERVQDAKRGRSRQMRDDWDRARFLPADAIDLTLTKGSGKRI